MKRAKKYFTVARNLCLFEQGRGTLVLQSCFNSLFLDAVLKHHFLP